MAESATSNGRITLVLATRNRKKGGEMVDLLAPFWESNPRLARLSVSTLAEHSTAPEPLEDADSFAGNARIKARAAAIALGVWVIADDSGLTVDALAGEPGVLSARYAGGHGDDDANNRKLLGALADVPDDQRGAAFVCALALSDPQGEIRAEAQGACRGLITREPRGSCGFGYDPLFLIPEYHQTFGELGPLAKHQLSHRARAFAGIRPLVERLVCSSPG